MFADAIAFSKHLVELFCNLRTIPPCHPPSLSKFIPFMLSPIDMSMAAFPEDEVLPVIKLRLICTSHVPSNRLSMTEVVQILELINPLLNATRDSQRQSGLGFRGVFADASAFSKHFVEIFCNFCLH